jgi:hypothetical protein
VVLAIALAVVITVLVVKPSDAGGGNGDGPTTPNGNSDFASANDTGPVNIITEDPTCAPWGRISREYSALTDQANWKDRAKDAPANAWTAEQRAVYETVAAGMAKAANESDTLARQTPSRVMRELYEQFAAYASIFVGRVTSYTPDDESYAAISNTLVSVVSNVCAAIQFDSAQAVAGAVEGVSPTARLDEPIEHGSEIFIRDGSSNSECEAWDEVAVTYNREIADWQKIDPAIAVEDWTPEQKATIDRVTPVMSTTADQFEEIGLNSDNAIFQDFALLSSQYLRAYVKTLPAYSSADDYLSRVANYMGGTINAACKVNA